MPRVAVVTVANKDFTSSNYQSSQKTHDFVYLTSRDEARGKKAVESLKKIGIAATFHQLDLNSQGSVDRFADYLMQNHGGLGCSRQ